jgi:hypothetical protein
MGFRTTQNTLSTTREVIVEARKDRKNITLINEDTAINIRIAENNNAVGFILYPQAVVTLDPSTGWDPSVVLHAVADSGTPIIGIVEVY